MRRSPWLDNRAELLAQILADRHDLQVAAVSMDDVRADISEHVDYVAKMMRIGRQAAKAYVTDEEIGKIADRIAREVERLRTRQALTPPRPSHLRVVRQWERA